jgi:selenium metabolism protein YedF
MLDQNFLLILTSSGIGDSTIDLGEKLMRGFFKTLAESQAVPEKIIFMNTSIFLTTESSPVLEELRVLESIGVKIISCQTCLNYFGRLDKLLIGTAGDMRGTVASIQDYSKVVTI